MFYNHCEEVYATTKHGEEKVFGTTACQSSCFVHNTAKSHHCQNDIFFTHTKKIKYRDLDENSNEREKDGVFMDPNFYTIHFLYINRLSAKLYSTIDAHWPDK